MQKESELKFPITFKMDEKNNKIDVYSEKLDYTITTKPFSCKYKMREGVNKISSDDNIMQEDDEFVYFVHEPQRKKSKSIFGSIANKILGSEDRYIIMIDKKTGSLYSGYIDDKGIFDHDIEIYHNESNDKRHIVSCSNEKKYEKEMSKNNLETLGKGKMFCFKDIYMHSSSADYEYYQGMGLLKYEYQYNTKFPYPSFVHINKCSGYAIDRECLEIVCNTPEKYRQEFHGEIKCIMHPDFEKAYKKTRENQKQMGKIEQKKEEKLENKKPKEEDKNYKSMYKENEYQGLAEESLLDILPKGKSPRSDRSL